VLEGLARLEGAVRVLAAAGGRQTQSEHQRDRCPRYRPKWNPHALLSFELRRPPTDDGGRTTASIRMNPSAFPGRIRGQWPRAAAWPAPEPGQYSEPKNAASTG